MPRWHLGSFGPASVAPESALGRQVSLFGLQDAAKSIQEWPKSRFGVPKALQMGPQRAQMASKKLSKGSPRALDHRKRRNCKNIAFTKEKSRCFKVWEISEGPRKAFGKRLDLQVRLLDQLWTAKFASWSAWSLRVGLPRALWAAK